MGILLQQEMGVIGLLSADVSAYVIDQREAETVCSSLMCLQELNQIHCRLFVETFEIYLPLGGIIS